MSLLKTFLYPLDFSGVAITNKIVGERRTITAGNSAAYNFFIPKQAAYFGDSMVVRHVASGVTLTKGVDWTPSYYYLSATNSAGGAKIYYGVTILNTALTGTFEIDYQTLGGGFTYDEESILEILAATTVDPRATQWESILNTPDLFDPDDHLHHVSETVGYDEMTATLAEIPQAVREATTSAEQLFRQHMENSGSNPHGLTAADIDLENVPNWSPAVSADLVDPDEYPANKLVSAMQVKQIAQDSVTLQSLGLATTTNQFSGLFGELPFAGTTDHIFDAQFGPLVERVNIVDTDGDLTIQLAARETSADTLANARRVAFDQNVMSATNATVWGATSTPDRITTTGATTALSALVFPETYTGDYTFTAVVASTANTTGELGLVLGIAEVEGKLRTLVALRTATATNASLRLVYDYLGDDETVIQSVTAGISSSASGWAGYGAGVQLSVTRVEGLLTVQTANTGGALLPGISIQLGSVPRLVPFMQTTYLGFAACNIANSTFQSTYRTGLQRPIVDLRTGTVHEWAATNQYVVSTRKASDIIKPGKLYRNTFRKRFHYASSYGHAYPLTGSVASFDLWGENGYTTKIPYVDSSGFITATTGVKYHHATTGALHGSHSVNADGSVDFFNAADIGYCSLTPTGIKYRGRLTAHNTSGQVLGYSESSATGGRFHLADNTWLFDYAANGIAYRQAIRAFNADGTLIGAVITSNDGSVSFENTAGLSHFAATPVDLSYRFKLVARNATNAVLGNIVTTTGGAVEMQNAAGVWLLKVAADGSVSAKTSFDLSTSSDVTLKTQLRKRKWVDDRVLASYDYVWLDHSAVAESLRNSPDSGIIAQHVQKLYPECVRLNEDTQTLRVDYSKLAVLLQLNYRLRPFWVRVLEFFTW